MTRTRAPGPPGVDQDFGQRRLELLRGPTALDRMDRLEARIGARCALWLKRDDAMGIGIGGNKLRSLEFWLGAARAAQADCVVVAGGPNSNLCRLTAAAAAMEGLDCIVLHDAPKSAAARGASFLNRLHGAEVRYLGAVGEAERGRRADATVAALRKAGRRPYLVGDGAMGALGHTRAAFELHAQNGQARAGIGRVFLPGSMGTTEAGFLYGNHLLGCPFEVHLPSVEYEAKELEARLARILGEIGALIGGPAPTPADCGLAAIDMAQRGAGYGEPTEMAETALLSLARAEGVLMEGVYTAKTFAAAVSLAGDGGPPICMIHTGGVPALFSQQAMFTTI